MTDYWSVGIDLVVGFVLDNCHALPVVARRVLCSGLLCARQYTPHHG